MEKKITQYSNLYDFLKSNKLNLIIRRNIHKEKEWSVEILHGWVKSKSFFLNVYGVGESETIAINDLIKQISGKVIVLNIDNDEKKRIIKVPFIYFLKVKENESGKFN